jgi:hypothetical protein
LPFLDLCRPREGGGGGLNSYDFFTAERPWVTRKRPTFQVKKLSNTEKQSPKSPFLQDFRDCLFAFLLFLIYYQRISNYQIFWGNMKIGGAGAFAAGRCENEKEIIGQNIQFAFQAYTGYQG